MIISDKRFLTKFDSKTGKKIWTYSPFDSAEINRVYKTKLLFENRFVGLFKFQGVKKENHDYYYTKCNLTILDVNDGQMIYSENIPNSGDETILYNNDYPNIKPDEFYMQRGDPTWRYRYLPKTSRIKNR